MKGLEVSLGRFFQDQLVECQLCNSSLELRVLFLELLELPGLVDAESAVLVPPAVVGVLSNTYLSDGLADPLAVGHGYFYLPELVQDLLR